MEETEIIGEEEEEDRTDGNREGNGRNKRFHFDQHEYTRIITNAHRYIYN